MTRGKKFDVFLSHTSHDKPWAIRLKDALQSRGLKVWLDRDEIRPGNLFIGDLENGLANSRAVALIVSPEALASNWVIEEYHRALNLTHEKNLQLIPIILRKAELPGFLANRSWVDFSDELTFNDNLGKLIWGITGKVPGELGMLPVHKAPIESRRIPLEQFKQELYNLEVGISRLRNKLQFACTIFEQQVMPSGCNDVRRRLNRDYEAIHKFAKSLEQSDHLPLSVVPFRYDLMTSLKIFDERKIAIDRDIEQFCDNCLNASNEHREEQSKIRRQLGELLRLRETVLDEVKKLYREIDEQTEK